VIAPYRFQPGGVEMATNEYALHSTWHAIGTVQEVYEIVSDASALASWWPAGFLKVTIVEPGDDIGKDKVLDVVSKGWLPYTIAWRQRVTEIDPPNGFTIEVSGGFSGRGIWSFAQEGNSARLEFEWRILADKALLRYGSPVVKPLFEWNHRWIMRKGLESLDLEVRRRRATTDTERAQVPPPPGPTWPHRRSALMPAR
jgi:hypothetical protein